MEDNIKNLLYSELVSATGYVNRLFQAVFISNLHSHRELKTICQEMLLDISEFFHDNILKDNFLYYNEEQESGEYYKSLKKINVLVESLIDLSKGNDKIFQLIVDYVNKLYFHARKLHQLCEELTILDIQYPRVNLISQVETLTESTIKEFRLSLTSIKQAASMGKDVFSSICMQREKKYEDLLTQGHKFIFNEKYQEGLESFQKALTYQETAEIFTLVAWGYMLNEDKDKAKSYCMKAIRKDPDYGPPYNDLGNILLSEGQVNEAIQWFNMAKKAPHYQHREYPYINSGRAYIMQNKIELAIHEFETALEIAPFHKELQEILTRIKSKEDDSSVAMVSDHLKNLTENSSTPLF